MGTRKAKPIGAMPLLAYPLGHELVTPKCINIILKRIFPTPTSQPGALGWGDNDSGKAGGKHGTYEIPWSLDF